MISTYIIFSGLYWTYKSSPEFKHTVDYGVGQVVQGERRSGQRLVVAKGGARTGPCQEGQEEERAHSLGMGTLYLYSHAVH